MLQRLPPEILLLIFRHFHHEFDRQDLLSICHVSRAFRQLAQPILFSKFDVDIGPGEFYANNFVPLALFTRTVLSRVDIQKATREMIVRGQDDPILWDDGRDTSSLSTETLTTLVDEMKRLGIDNNAHSRYSTDMISGEINPILVVLAANLERLEMLKISFVTYYMSSLLNMFDTGMAQPYFSKLTSINLELVCVDEDPAMDIIYLERILPLLALPRLQHFGANRCLGDDAYQPEEDTLPNAMNISSISLVDSCLDHLTMVDLIMASESLKSFTYVVNVDIIENLENSDPINTEELLDVLSCHEETLTEVHIEMKERRGGLGERPTKFESFAPLRNLRELDIEQATITDAPELPESLQVLRVRTCTRPVFELVDFLVKEKKRRFCNLEVVKVAPRSMLCTAMLGMEPSFLDVRVFTEEESKVTEFKEQVQRLEAIIRGADFKFYAECMSYNIMSRRMREGLEGKEDAERISGRYDIPEAE